MPWSSFTHWVARWFPANQVGSTDNNKKDSTDPFLDSAAREPGNRCKFICT